MPNVMLLKDISLLAQSDPRPLPKGTLPLPRHHVTYTLFLDSDTTDPQGLTVRFKDVLIGDGEAALAINIFCDAKIWLKLDQTAPRDWEFALGDGMTLNNPPPNDVANERYFNYTPKPVGTLGRMQHATFDAKRALTGAPADKYNLRVLVHRGPDGMVYSPPLERFIDPDIKNPGSYGLLDAAI